MTYFRYMKQMSCVLILMAMLPSLGVAQKINTDIIITSTVNEGLKKQATASIQGALQAFQVAYNQQSTPDLSASHFTERGREAALELWNRTPFRCIYTLIDGPLLRRSVDNLHEFRGVTLHLEDASGEFFREEGVFVIDRDGLITDFKFGLDTQTYTQILEERKDVSDFRKRQIILNFVDNFRTAYNRKDVSYLNDLFSDNALIIVGRVVQVAQNSELSDQFLGGLDTQRIELIKHSKEEYLKRLSEVFDKNEYIKVEFDSISVYPHANVEGIYGVELTQHWHSYSTRQDGYRDEGYLFLMIDLRDEEQPMIHVRTWQPKEVTPRDDVINLSNFKIID